MSDPIKESEPLTDDELNEIRKEIGIEIARYGIFSAIGHKRTLRLLLTIDELKKQIKND